MGQRTSVYLDDDLHAAVKASGVPLAELIRRGLVAGTAGVTPPATTSMMTTTTSLAALHDGEPSPGVLCAGPAASSATPASTASASSRCVPPAPPPFKAGSTSASCHPAPGG